jgi:hypothetical protein
MQLVFADLCIILNIMNKIITLSQVMKLIKIFLEMDRFFGMTSQMF